MTSFTVSSRVSPTLPNQANIEITFVKHLRQSEKILEKILNLVAVYNAR